MNMDNVTKIVVRQNLIGASASAGAALVAFVFGFNILALICGLIAAACGLKIWQIRQFNQVSAALDRDFQESSARMRDGFMNRPWDR